MTIRKFAVVPLFALLLAGLAACGGNKTQNTASNAAAPMATTGAMSMATGAMEGGGAMSAAGTIPNCGAVKAVWVNLKTKVYHEPGDPMYGKTKHGKYLCPAAAKKDGYRPAGGKHHGAM